MSDRIDTEAVRRRYKSFAGNMSNEIRALCDEVDRLRAALLIAAEQCVSTTDPDEIPWLIDRWMTRARAALGDQEAKEEAR